MNKYALFISAILLIACSKHPQTYNLTDFGISPNTRADNTQLIQKALSEIISDTMPKIIRFEKGRYDFFENQAAEHEYYISNHDQTNPKRVGIVIENAKNITIDGQGSEFIFHGRMLPISIVKTENFTLKNISIDFEHPQIGQVEIKQNNPQKGIVFEIAPWINYRINANHQLEFYDGNQSSLPMTGIAFEKNTRHICYNTSDLYYDTKNCKEIAPRIFIAPNWKDSRLIAGNIIVMRTWSRPAPAIFLSESKNTTLQNISIHYAEGMGLLAQISENITLDNFNVCLKGENDPRYFTTQADATHFSGCKGKILSQNSLYENMMDDAINVHGTYLKIAEIINENTVIGQYMHPQSWGFKWGEIGDSVQFIRAESMDTVGHCNQITDIQPYDTKTICGAKKFRITFKNKLPQAINEIESFGIENMTWTPEVIFKDNIIRNNRARGVLFSTPKKVQIENNLFDHTSGTAILLCGDCNGWYETGACRQIEIRNNTFINTLTNLFQFTNAIISIYPEIPDLKKQKNCFHGGNGNGVTIESNLFETFDQPIVYAKSLDGLIFKNNKIKSTSDYKAFHWNKHKFFFQKVKNFSIENNEFETGFDAEKDIRNE